jgi:branched-chain amino acid transport system substrate-binding protein
LIKSTQHIPEKSDIGVSKMKLNKSQAVTLAVLLCLLVVTAGCGGGGEKKLDSALLVGMVNPFSGDSATYGISHKNGFELAREEINKAGGIKGQKIEAVFHDDAGDPKQAAAGAQKFADQKSLLAVAGSCLSSNTLAMVPILDKAHVTHTVVSSSTPKLSGASKYFFRMAVQDAQVGVLIGDFISKEVKAKKAAILYPNNDYGKGLAASTEEQLKKNGVTVVANKSYLATDKDYSALLTVIKSEGAEALALAGTYTDSALIAKQSREMGMNIPMVGPPGLYSPKLIEIAGPAAEGAIFLGAFVASNPEPAVQDFVKKYKEKYNIEPDTFAALAYDQMYVLAKAMEKAAERGPITRESLQEAMAKTDYKGITGSVNFNDKGDWVRPYLHITVRDGKFVLFRK